MQLLNKYGFINEKGEKIIRCKFDDALDFSEGFAAVMLNGKWDYIDTKGNEVIPLKYASASKFNNGLAEVGAIASARTYYYIGYNGEEYFKGRP